MKRISSWVTWILLTAVLWIGWGLGVLGPLCSKEARLIDERYQLEQQKAEALRLLGAAPTLVRQIDSVNSQFREVTSSFAAEDDLQRLFRELNGLARRHGARRVEVSPDLASILGIPVGTAAAAGDSPALDTLLIGFSAQGRFLAIGAWLDEIEKRADFQKWIFCRWEGGEEGIVSFSGRAAFWVLALSPAS